MGKSSKKPRKKTNANEYDVNASPPKKKEVDWTFEDILRSKSRRR